jgi:chemotaxis protein MotB
MIRPRSGQDQDNGSPPWMTTYGDMMTLLLCFFVLLYAFSITDIKKFRSALSSINTAISGQQGKTVQNKGGLFKQQSEILKRLKKDNLPQRIGLTRGEISQMKATKEEIKNYLKNQRYGQSIDLNITERGLVISFMGQVLFESGKADIKSEIIPLLNHVASILKKKDNSIRIEGFTDNVPINNEKYPSNWELSTARATAVLKYLVSKQELDPNRLSAAGYGEYKPRKPNTSEASRALNRRIDMVVLFPSLEIGEPK